MPPGGCDGVTFASDIFYEYEPHPLPPEEIQNRRLQQHSFLIFQETLNQVRVLAEQLHEQFQQAAEQTARIHEEQRKLRRAITRQRKMNRRRKRLREEKDEQRREVIKMFFSCRERREAFPDLARQYLQSIS